MKRCVSCDKPIDETKANKYRDSRARAILCEKCAAEFAAEIMKSDDNKNPMPPEINNPDIIEWNPKERTGKVADT